MAANHGAGRSRARTLTATEGPLHGQVALVTGAAVRIGREIASALAAEGASVVVHYRRSEQEARGLCSELAERGARSWAMAADLDDPGEAERLVERVLEATQRLDLLVNSASIFPASRLPTLELEGLFQSLRVNTWAPLVLSRRMAAACAQGRIVNLVDSGLTSYDRDHAGYALSKLALWHLTDMLALELAPRFTVNAVAPGLILPPAGREDEYLRDKARAIPLQRPGSPQDVARAVLFLVESPFITGQTIFVDGGGHLLRNRQWTAS